MENTMNDKINALPSWIPTSIAAWIAGTGNQDIFGWIAAGMVSQAGKNIPELRAMGEEVEKIIPLRILQLAADPYVFDAYTCQIRESGAEALRLAVSEKKEDWANENSPLVVVALYRLWFEILHEAIVQGQAACDERSVRYNSDEIEWLKTQLQGGADLDTIFTEFAQKHPNYLTFPLNIDRETLEMVTGVQCTHGWWGQLLMQAKKEV
jgi:hypothetical protein